MHFSVTQFGKPLDASKYTWDPNKNIFSTNEHYLTIDWLDDIDDDETTTFCTGNNCVFRTLSNCIFYTGFECQFRTADNCEFHTGNSCIFKTSDDCDFRTGDKCVFNTGCNSVFYTGTECIVIRRDIFETFQLNAGQRFKLNGFMRKGGSVLSKKKKVTLELTDEQLEQVQALLNGS